MNGKVYVTSDLHIGHKLVSVTRGFASVEEHDECVRQNIWDTVRPKDTLWILGDLLFNKSTKSNVLAELLAGCGANIKVVLGNHDDFTPDTLRFLGINKAYGAAYGKKGILFTHIPVHPGQKGRFTLNVHGHLHEQVLPDPWYFNVCLEQNNLKPFNIEEIYEKIPLLPLVGADELHGTPTLIRKPRVHTVCHADL